MSTKNVFRSSGGIFAGSIKLVALAIIFSSGSAAVSQQTLAEPPLVGGFKIDFGDGDETLGRDRKPSEQRDYRTADEVVRSLMQAESARGGDVENALPAVFSGESVGSAAVSVTNKPARPSADPSVVNPFQTPAVQAEKSVPGLPRAALPMSFPAASPQSGPAKGPATLIHAGDMIGFSRELGDGVQAITIINASRRWMAVYHIGTSGQIRLTSSRPLDADFTIQFNATEPLPEDIRRLQGK